MNPPTNSSQSDTLQVKSPIIVKHHIFWYNLGFPNPPKGNFVRHILILLSLFLFSFTYISCSKSSDDGSKSTDTTTWTKQLGASSDDWGYGVTIDSLGNIIGNIYVTGRTGGGLDGNTNSGETDIFLVKYNSSGTKQWTKQLGTSYNDYGQGVTTDSSGNIYVTGYTNGGGLDGNTNLGGRDIFLVKYN